jgi:hypothetical protein
MQHFPLLNSSKNVRRDSKNKQVWSIFCSFMQLNFSVEKLPNKALLPSMREDGLTTGIIGTNEMEFTSTEIMKH